MVAAKKDKFSEADIDAFNSGKVALPSANKALFNAVALATSLLPVFLFVTIQHLDFFGNIIVYAIFAAASSQLLTYAYSIQADEHAPKLRVKREASVKASSEKKQSYETTVQQAGLIANNEAIFGSIFYNNALFVLLTLVFGNFLFVNFSPLVGYALTALAAPAFTVLSHV